MLVLMVLALLAVPLVLAGWLMSWLLLDSDRRPFAQSPVLARATLRHRR